jgi:lipopolysaccharide biosynthesis protein
VLEGRAMTSINAVAEGALDGAPLVFSIAPLNQLRTSTQADGATVYTAEGDDPQLLVAPDRAARRSLVGVAAIEIRWRADLLDGEFREPCVFVDWGDGFGAESQALLQPDGEGGFVAFVPARGPECRRIRLDPSTRLCRFRVIDLSVQASGSLSFSTPTARNMERVKRALGPVRGLLRRVRRRATHLAQRNVLLSRAGLWLAGGHGRWRESYDHAFAVARHLRSEHYAARSLDKPSLGPHAPRLMAFYLPQFHPFPENDRWWGKGFTEWTNVTKAMPQFKGHYQPRLAGDLGYYDLRNVETIRDQIELARGAGLHGFCFHYYWFAGKRLLERPLDAFLKDDNDFPFSICWANENWTRRWDGQDSEILIAQEHSASSDLAIFDDMARYIRDPRYLRVDGKPVLIVYRPDALPDAKSTLQRWRGRARELGLGELRILCTNAFGFTDYALFGFDGLVQFPPHAIQMGEITSRVPLLNPSFSGKVYDYPTVAAGQIQELERLDPNVVPGVVPGWDNEARRSGGGHVFHGANPVNFRRWLAAAARHAARTQPGGLAFINAWNEWAEGAYLEPDRWFGHGYLQAVRSVMNEYAPKLTAADIVSRDPVRRSDSVVILHLYYEDLIDQFAARLAAGPHDCIVTIPDTWSQESLRRLNAALPDAQVILVENQGRDILPFLHGLQRATAMGYDTFCKVHAKRSPHLGDGDGDAWRDRLVDALLSPAAVEKAQWAFAADPRLGLLGAGFSKTSLAPPDVMHNNRFAADRLSKLLAVSYSPRTDFAAGSMFWGRTAAFGALLRPDHEAFAFELEMGRIDGTVAHALERLFGAIVVSAGWNTSWEL